MLQQMVVMFLMMAVGYLCYKKQILTEEVSKKASAIVVNVANPCMILSSALTDQQMRGRELLQTLAIVTLMYALLLVVAQLLPGLLRIRRESRGAYAAMTVFTNIGFMGFPVLAAMYGNGALLYGAVFQIPFNTLIYTYGVAVLTRKPDACGKTVRDGKTEIDGNPGEQQDARDITEVENEKPAGKNTISKENDREQHGKLQEIAEVVKKIFNIGVIACIAAMLIYFLRIPVPSFLQAFITNLGNLTAPLSMMIIGASLAQMPLKELFLDRKLLLFSFIKLLVLPAVWMLMVNRMAEQEILRGVCLVMMATPAGSMTAMLAQQYGGDYETASRGVALTTVLSVITMPVLAALFL